MSYRFGSSTEASAPGGSFVYVFFSAVFSMYMSLSANNLDPILKMRLPYSARTIYF